MRTQRYTERPRIPTPPRLFVSFHRPCGSSTPTSSSVSRIPPQKWPRHYHECRPMWTECSTGDIKPAMLLLKVPFRGLSSVFGGAHKDALCSTCIGSTCSEQREQVRIIRGTAVPMVLLGVFRRRRHRRQHPVLGVFSTSMKLVQLQLSRYVPAVVLASITWLGWTFGCGQVRTLESSKRLDGYRRVFCPFLKNKLLFQAAV